MTPSSRLRTFFCQTKHWKSYDPFSKQKTDTFRSSRSAVLELAARYNSLSTELSKTQSSNPTENESAHRILFHEMCKICLWGNATDLSLLTETSLSDLQKLQGSAAIQAAESNIIVNDIDRAFDVLYSAKTRSTNTTNNSNTSSSERRIDIVLDNAGFELYADLLLAGYLLQSGLATQVVLHPKDIPWFVSDVTPRDFGDLLSLVANAHELYGGDAPSDASGNVSASDRPLASPTTAALSADEKSVLDELAAHWMQVYAEGGIVMRPNPYWTRSNGFWDVKDVAPELYEDLQSSAMVIFKGDLNYRKLTCDVRSWNPPFLSPYPPSRLTCASSWRGRTRLNGRLRWDRSGTRAMVSESWRSGHARLMLWWVCQRGWMRHSRYRMEARRTNRQAHGPGLGNMLLYNSRMGKCKNPSSNCTPHKSLRLAVGNVAA